jgi:2-haloacid dehalogenase
VLFDAYGTLFDVHSVIAQCEKTFPGQGAALSQAWRTKQLETTWLRSLGNRYVSFWQITQDALDVALRQLKLECTLEARTQILNSYFSLNAYAEVHSVLDQLRAKNLITGTLSNGSPEMLNAVLDSANVRGKLDHVISVDPVRRYKPDPVVYQLGVDQTGIPAAQILFVSSNAWDVAGASWFGTNRFGLTAQAHPLMRWMRSQWARAERLTIFWRFVEHCAAEFLSINIRGEIPALPPSIFTRTFPPLKSPS